MSKLTARRVATEKKPGLHGDGGGLYLHVSATGARSWILRTMVRGKRRDIGLGGVSWVSLSEARAKARELRALARNGGNPLAHRDRKIPTFEEAARKVHAEQIVPTTRSPKSRDQWINSLSAYAFPLIGVMPVDQIDHTDVLRVLTPIWLKKAVTARRVRQRLRTVFAWARTAGHRELQNPVDDIERGLAKQTHRVKHLAAMPWAEVPGFIVDLRAREGLAARALELAILTACRRGEVLGGRWEEIDMDAGVWIIPPQRMKAGNEHRVPLTDEAVALLRSIEGLDDELVFPGQRRGKPLSKTALEDIMAGMGRPVTMHGFRSSFRDWCAERTHFPREIAELSLAHRVGDAVERAYRRSDLFDKRRKLMSAWARFCASGTGAKAGGNVVGIRG